MGFNSAFKGLNSHIFLFYIKPLHGRLDLATK